MKGFSSINIIDVGWIRLRGNIRLHVLCEYRGMGLTETIRAAEVNIVKVWQRMHFKFT